MFVRRRRLCPLNTKNSATRRVYGLHLSITVDGVKEEARKQNKCTHKRNIHSRISIIIVNRDGTTCTTNQLNVKHKKKETDRVYGLFQNSASSSYFVKLKKKKKCNIS